MMVISLDLIRRGWWGWNMMCRIIIGGRSGQTKVHHWFVVGDLSIVVGFHGC